jgi:predicted HTH transcriptional regulator
MNAEGGTLLIGVSDEGAVLGLDADYATLGSKANRDGYELFLTQLFKNCVDGAAHALVRTTFESLDGRDVCRIDVAASGRPVFARGPEGKELNEFWVRTGNATRLLVGSEAVEYQQAHWG